MNEPVSPLLALTLFSLCVGYVIATLSMIIIATDNAALSPRQKWGYVLGFVGALPIFLPLYFILSPSTQES